MGKAGLVNGKTFTYVLGKQQPLLCMWPLVPTLEVNEVLKVLAEQVIDLYPIKVTDVFDTIRSRID